MSFCLNRLIPFPLFQCNLFTWMKISFIGTKDSWQRILPKWTSIILFHLLPPIVSFRSWNSRTSSSSAEGYEPPFPSFSSSRNDDFVRKSCCFIIPSKYPDPVPTDLHFCHHIWQWCFVYLHSHLHGWKESILQFGFQLPVWILPHLTKLLFIHCWTTDMLLDLLQCSSGEFNFPPPYSQRRILQCFQLCSPEVRPACQLNPTWLFHFQQATVNALWLCPSTWNHPKSGVESLQL